MITSVVSMAVYGRDMKLVVHVGWFTVSGHAILTLGDMQRSYRRYHKTTIK